MHLSLCFHADPRGVGLWSWVSHGGRSTPRVTQWGCCLCACLEKAGGVQLSVGTASLLNVRMLGSISREFETKPGSIEGDTVFSPLNLVSFPFLSLFPFLLPFSSPILKWPRDRSLAQHLLQALFWQLLQWDYASDPEPNVSFRSFKGENSYLSETTKTLFSSPPHFVKLQSCFSSTQRFSGLWMCPDVHGMNKAVNLYSSHFFWQGVVIIN